MYDRAIAPTLAELILQRKGGRSFERLSEDCGGVPAGRRLQQLSTPSRPMKNFLDPETITGMARGLGVSEKDIVLASARSLGIRMDAGGPDALVIPDAGRLPEAAQIALMDMARVLIAAHGL